MNKAGRCVACLAVASLAFIFSDAAFAISQRSILAGEAEVKQLLGLMDTDRNERVSKAEFLRYMGEEFDYLDVDHSGELDPNELSRLRVHVNPGWHK